MVSIKNISYEILKGGDILLGLEVEETYNVGEALAQCLRSFATNRKVAGSIPDGVIRIFL